MVARAGRHVVTAHDRFEQAFGRPPTGLWAAPGRVNLIGEHTDYNEGFVLPLALAERIAVAVAPARTDHSTVRSVQRPGAPVQFSAAAVAPGDVTGWGAYVAGVVWALRTAGCDVPDLDVVVDGDLPIGAGLSSSAAITCAMAVAIVDVTGFAADRDLLATCARRAENNFVGAPTGVMDQMAAMHGRAGHLVFLDTRSMAVEHVPFAVGISGSDLVLLVIDTGTRHELVDSEYGDRRRSCEEAARILGVRALRDIPLDDLPDCLDLLPTETHQRRVRHVVTEDARVLDVVVLLRAGADPGAIGPALTASHVSLRDDYAVTTPPLDLAVDAALDAGAYGARMTGGGFGGCAIALVDRAQVARLEHAVRSAFAVAGFPPPTSFAAVASDGAGRIG
jgi:galactokinase